MLFKYTEDVKDKLLQMLERNKIPRSFYLYTLGQLHPIKNQAVF
jgi:hypothetical protein